VGPKRWELFPHDADIGVRGMGATIAEAFEQAGLALTGVVVDPGSVRPERPVRIEGRADDADGLLFDWLNALVYEMGTRGLLFGRYEVEVDAGAASYRATAWGEPVDVARHQPAVEVKGATYTSLRVARDEEGTWTAECVVDV
jgi:protein archease